jgi:thiol-disulfide isomerase/thioredoxin
VLPERVLILLGFVVLIALIALVARGIAARRLSRLRAAGGEQLWAALGLQPDGRAAVVAFSSPSCAACRTAQVPALRALEAQLGPNAVRIVTVDLADRPEAASAFGVLTVPSTVVLAPSGDVLAANNGFAPADRLVEQVTAARGR